MTPKQRLFLIDGYALIYRAFFAMISRPLRTSRGENTSAAWGVANFLHRLFEQHQPDYVAWVHDAGTSFRQALFPDYKATREKLDAELREDFVRAVERIEELLAAWRVTLVSVDGYEADDVIGTLATHGANAGFAVVVVSGDKDFYQLIGPDVRLLNPGRRGPASVDEHWVDLSNARERFGVEPERVVDFLALTGDSSDNVPGVRGVGPKTAVKLIDEFGDLEGILTRAEEVSSKRAREALIEHADAARLSRRLVTIECEVPLEVALEDLRARDPDARALATIYGELEFHTLISRLSMPEPAAAVAADATPRVAGVDDLAGLAKTVRRAGSCAIDVITATGWAGSAEVVGFAIGVGQESWYLPLGHRPPSGELITEVMPSNLPDLNRPELSPVVQIFADASVAKVGHDIKRSILVLRRHGIDLRGARHDTMLASFVIDPSRRSHDLELLAREYLQVELPLLESLTGKGRGARELAEIGIDAVAGWANARVRAVGDLRQPLDREVDDRGGRRLFAEIEMPLIAVLADLEWQGIALDTDRIAELAAQFTAEMTALEASVYDEAGGPFNINSTPQLRHVLFEKLQLPVIKRTKTGPSTDADVLGELAALGHRLPTLLIEYREIAKLRSTYVDTLPAQVDPRTGRVHTSFSQTGAATGRLSSSDPNLQNIPVRTERGGEIRRCFVAAQGIQLIIADYSQIELRILAHLSGDAAFVDAFRRGGDVHRETAAIIFDVPVDQVTAEMRARAKTINFATIYGQGAFALARQLGITQDEARDFIQLYFERFAGVRAYLDACVELAKTRGYSETLFERRRYIPELKDRNFNVRAFGERVAMNSPLQGSAADLIKRAMIEIGQALREAALDSRMLLQVHDELVVESPEAQVSATVSIVQRAMEQAAHLDVPLVVDVGVGPNWLDAKA